MYGSKYGTGTIHDVLDGENNAVYNTFLGNSANVEVFASTGGSYPSNPYSANFRWLGLNFIVCDISGHATDTATDVLFVPF
jgi:hypothetical protein